MTVPRPSWARVWLAAIRPRTLPLSATPVLAGSALAWALTGVFRADVFAAALGAGMAIQVATNMHNDAIDSLNGTDQDDRLGPPRVTQKGWLGAKTVLSAAHATFALALLAGLYLVWVGGWPILALGILSIAAGYAYSVGPWPLSRIASAEAFVVLFFGLIGVGGTYYLTTGGLNIAALVMGLAVGLPTAAVLTVNNTRDIESDTRAGRRTLSILIGREGSTRLYGALLAGGVACALALTLFGPPLMGCLAAAATLPLAVRTYRMFRDAKDGPTFNQVLAKTAAFPATLCVCICIGLGLTRLI